MVWASKGSPPANAGNMIIERRHGTNGSIKSAVPKSRETTMRFHAGILYWGSGYNFINPRYLYPKLRRLIERLSR